MSKQRKSLTTYPKSNKHRALPPEIKKALKLMSPEDLFALTRRLNAVQGGRTIVQNDDEIDEDVEDEEEEFEVEEEIPAPRRSTSMALVPRVTAPVVKKEEEKELPDYTRAPWYEHGMTETDAMVISLSAKGLSQTDIRSQLQMFHNTDIPAIGITAITEKVNPLVKDWQIRPLSPCYPILYLDGIHYKVKDSGQIKTKVAYVALGINTEGQKEILGIWVGESESAKFWAGILTDIKNRGVKDVLVTCVDGLAGFPEAIRNIFPRSEVQVCIVHQIRHTLMFISHKDRKEFAEDLKEVYTATNEDAGAEALDEMIKIWPQYGSYLRNWKANWGNLAPFFSYPYAIRRMIYTTNTIENLNKQFRAVTKNHPYFHSDDALVRLLWLAQAEITDKWHVTARSWGEIMAQFNDLFPNRISGFN